MNSATVLWQRMMTAARTAAQRHGWRAAARIRRAWTEWYYRQMRQRQQPQLVRDSIDARLRAVFLTRQKSKRPVSADGAFALILRAAVRRE